MSLLANFSYLSPNVINVFIVSTNTAANRGFDRTEASENIGIYYI